MRNIARLESKLLDGSISDSDFYFLADWYKNKSSMNLKKYIAMELRGIDVNEEYKKCAEFEDRFTDFLKISADYLIYKSKYDVCGSP